MKFSKARIAYILFVSFFSGGFSQQGEAAAHEDHEGLGVVFSARPLHSQPKQHLVLDPSVGLPYVSDGGQAYLQSFSGSMQPYKKGEDCAIFRPHKRSPASAIKMPSETASLKGGISSTEHSSSLEHKQGFLGVLAPNKRNKQRAVSSAANFSQLRTTFGHGSMPGRIPSRFSEQHFTHAQNFSEGMTSLEGGNLSERNTRTLVEGGLNQSISISNLSEPTPPPQEEQRIPVISSSPQSSHVEASEGGLSERVSPSLPETKLQSISLKETRSSTIGEVLYSPPSVRKKNVSSTENISKVTSVPSLSSLSPESYFVDNPGEKVRFPNVAPWSSIAHLKLMLEDTDGTLIRTYVGTGCVIDVSSFGKELEDSTAPKNRYLLSAAHNAYLRAYKTGISRIEIYPGLSPDAVPSKSIADLYIVHPAYVESADDSYKKFDIAIIKVSEPFDESIAKMPLKVANQADLEKALIEIWGYPAMVHEKTDESSEPVLKMLNGQLMYKMGGTVLSAGENQIFYDASTYPGQSGGPVVKDAHVLGVHTYGGGSPSEGNCGTRISPEILDLLWHWIQKLEEESLEDASLDSETDVQTGDPE